MNAAEELHEERNLWFFKKGEYLFNAAASDQNNTCSIHGSLI